MAKTLPYHEWLLGAIKSASFVVIHELAPMIKEVTIPAGHHDPVIDAWNAKIIRLKLDNDLGVPTALREQKKEAEAEATAKMADTAFAGIFTHDG